MLCVLSEMYAVATFSSHIHFLAVDDVDATLLRLCHAAALQVVNYVGLAFGLVVEDEFDRCSGTTVKVDDEGTRGIKTPSESGYRIQPDSNVVLNYLQGKFGGLPWKDMDIDFKDIASTSK